MMKVLSLDLEFNQPSGKIIQVGAAIGSLESLKIERTFSVLVNPEEVLAPEISKLTGISVEALVSEGVSLTKAVSALQDFAADDARFLNPVTWGGPDGEELRQQLEASLDGWMFGRRWIDVKTLHVANNLAFNVDAKGGLARSMLQYGLRFEGRKHNAKDDAINTLRLFFEMTRRLRAQKPSADLSPN